MQKPLAANADQLDALFGRFLRRFARVSANTIESFAEAFAHYIRFTEVPRDLRAVAGQLGIELEASLLAQPGQAHWERVEDRYFIRYGRYAVFQKAAFGIAHELFEMLSAHPAFPTFLAPEREEILANRFAAQFLMPAVEVKAAAKEYERPDLRRYLVPKLADRFRVSRPAMQIRLRDLGLLNGSTGRFSPR